MTAAERPATRLAALLAAVIVATAIALPDTVRAQDGSFGSRFVSDFRYVANNGEADAEDFVTAPWHVGGVLREPRFYFTLLGAGAAIGGALALDQTLRARLRDMSGHDATRLQNISLGLVGAEAVLLYGYGLYAGDAPAREYAITGAESAALVIAFAQGLKYAFGRLRPNQHHGAFAFFDGGRSFVSDTAALAFAIAAAVSEYGENQWYVAIPAYGAAVGVGLGRMGHDEHWFSDIVGSAVVGVLTTEVLLYLHRNHASEPSRYRIFPVASPQGSALAFNVTW